MSKRRVKRGSSLIVVAVAAAFNSANASARQGLAVNGPLEISLSPAPIDISSEAAQSAAQISFSDLSSGKVTVQPSPPTAPLSQNESKPLGQDPQTSRKKPDAEKASSGGAPWDSRQSEITRVFGALAAVIGLVLLMRFAIKRFGGAGGHRLGAGAGRPSGVVEILARYPVARGQQLVVLKLARRILLLHQSGGSMNALAEINEPQEVAGLLSRMEAGSSERNAAKFRNTLAEFMQENPHPKSESKASGRTVLPKGEAEIIDLTRRQGGFLRSLLTGRTPR